MKNILSTFLLAFFALTSFAQLSNTQSTVITKISADWCPHCGLWGWDAFEQMRADFEGKDAILVLAHYDGDLMNDVSKGWTDNLDNQYQPEFFLNNDNQDMGSSTYDQAIISMEEQIDLLSDLGSFAGVVGQGYTDDQVDLLHAEVDVEFFTELTGDYYLGVYILQNNILAYQSQQGTVLQPNLLTGAFTDEWYGVPISGSIGLQSMEFSMDRPANFSDADGDTEILSVIWNKLPDGTYNLFNAHVNSSIAMVSNTNDLNISISSFKATLDQNKLNVQLDSDQKLENASIVLTSVSGQKVFQKNGLNINEGNTAFSYNVNNLNTGMYIMSLQFGDSVISKKIFKN